MESAGLWMLALVVVVLITSGLPAFVVLIGVSALFAVVGVATGSLDYPLLTALPLRIIGLMETDILQALPLYVLMGALLDRLPLAETLFRAGTVGASTATLSRVLYPRIVARGVMPAQSLSLVCVASTFGVVVPPSLVLILLGDTMLRAHTEAINATRVLTQVINTQDVFRGALVPAGLFVLACAALAWWIGRRANGAGERIAVGVRLGWRGWSAAILAPLFIVGLLAAVVAGYVYAVEAAATGALTLVLSGVITRTLRGDIWAAVLRDTMAVTGALFALFVAATTFTLVFRAFGSDRLLATRRQSR